MKTTHIVKSVALTAMLSAFATTASADMTNRERVAIFYDAYNQNDASILDQVLAPDWESIPAVPGREQGLEAFLPSIAYVNAIFEDLSITNDDILVDGNTVIVRSTVEGTNVESFSGFPAQGRPVSIMAIDIHHFNDEGLVTRTYHLEDWLSGLFQMGAFDQ